MTQKYIIPAKHGKAFKVSKGDSLKLINTFGTQVVDCWALSAKNQDEHMCMEASRVWLQRLNPIIGDTFVTNKRNPILTVVEDTSPGIHDTFMAACDKKRYELLGVDNYHRNCSDNLIEALEDKNVFLERTILASFNIFMNIEVQSDKITLKTLPTLSKPGDYIILRAEMDCYVVFSSCPQDIVKIQGQNDNTPKSVEVEITKNDKKYQNIKIRECWKPSV